MGLGRYIWLLWGLGTVILIAAALWFYRFEITLRVQAGGRPLVRARLRLRIFGLVMRREWRFDQAEVTEVARRALLATIDRQSEALPSSPAPRPRAAGRPGPSIVQPMARVVLEALSLRRLSLRVGISTGDAAQTAVACGLLNALGGLAAIAVRRLPHAPRRIAVAIRPVWRPDRMWRADLRCIASPRLSQAIPAAWHLYFASRAASAGQPRARPQVAGRWPRLRLGGEAGTISRARRG